MCNRNQNVNISSQLYPSLKMPAYHVRRIFWTFVAMLWSPVDSHKKIRLFVRIIDMRITQSITFYTHCVWLSLCRSNFALLFINWNRDQFLNLFWPYVDTANYSDRKLRNFVFNFFGSTEIFFSRSYELYILEWMSLGILIVRFLILLVLKLKVNFTGRALFNWNICKNIDLYF